MKPWNASCFHFNAEKDSKWLLKRLKLLFRRWLLVMGYNCRYIESIVYYSVKVSSMDGEKGEQCGLSENIFLHGIFIVSHYCWWRDIWPFHLRSICSIPATSRWPTSPRVWPHTQFHNKRGRTRVVLLWMLSSLVTFWSVWSHLLIIIPQLEYFHINNCCALKSSKYSPQRVVKYQMTGRKWSNVDKSVRRASVLVV